VRRDDPESEANRGWGLKEKINTYKVGKKRWGIHGRKTEGNRRRTQPGGGERSYNI